MKLIIKIVAFLIPTLCLMKFEGEKEEVSFTGEIYYESFESHSLSFNTLENTLEKIDHPLLKEKIDKYQIDKDLLVNNTYDYEENALKNVSNIQVDHIQKMYLIPSPDIRDKAKLEALLSKKPEYLYRKENLIKKELNGTEIKKNILGLSCKKYLHETYNKYTKQEFITEYWIQEDMIYDQHKLGNLFGKIFTDKGTILETVGLLKPSMDTFSRKRAVKINFVDDFKIDLDKLGL